MKFHIIINATVLCSLFSVATAQAQNQVLTLAEARAKALEQNKEIKKANLTVEQTGYDVKTYKSNYFPRVSLVAIDAYSSSQGDFTIQGGNLPIYTWNPSTGQYVPNVMPQEDGTYKMTQYAMFPDKTIEYKIKNIFNAGIQLKQPLYMGGKITAAYNMAKLGHQMAKDNIRLTESEVLVRTDEAYSQAVRAKELAQVAQSYKALLTELQKNVESAVKHGMKTRNDQLKVQVKLNEAELSIQKAENAYRLARMNLSQIMGYDQLNYDYDVVSPDSLSIEPNTLVQDVLNAPNINSRPEVTLLQSKTTLSSEQVKLAKSEFMPNLALLGGASYTNGIEVAGRKLIDKISGYVGVTLNIPILTFGERGSKIRSAKAKHQLAEMEEQDLHEKMQLELMQCQNNYNEAQTELQLCQHSLEQAKENMRLTRKQYDVGLEPLSELLDAQALWQSCSANLVEARCQLQLAETKLLKAAGQLK
ncbi:MAG: TolC family protein [Bacteroidaceae bacterium]|nr:TolC family protein [Bacteroidaceae bacterium]